MKCDATVGPDPHVSPRPVSASAQASSSDSQVGSSIVRRNPRPNSPLVLNLSSARVLLTDARLVARAPVPMGLPGPDRPGRLDPHPPLSRQPSELSLRSGRQTLVEPNYFSTLPPSPHGSPSGHSSNGAAYVHSPSAERIGSAFQLAMEHLDAGVTLLDSSRRSSGSGSSDSGQTYGTPSLLLSPPLVVQSEIPPRERRRPAEIVPPMHGLALQGHPNMIGSPQPSPRLRRFYPVDPSTTPLPSPVAASFTFPSPLLTHLSPPLGSPSSSHSSSASPKEPGKSSPGLAALTDPLARLANGLTQRVRRKSTASDLPLARSPTPSVADPPMRSPMMSRGASYATQAREREREKETTLKERQRKAAKDKAHLRMFSWATRPDDLSTTAVGTGEGRWKRVVLVLVALALLGGVAQQMGALDRAPKPVMHVRTSRLRRPAVGNSFIHPDVLDPLHRRPKPSRLMAPYHLLANFFAGESHSSPSHPAGPVSRSRSAPDPVKSVQPGKKKSIFVAAPRVAFVDHHPLPPPLTHGDAPDRDTLVLYRILGNDLPPRHSPGQTLRNLRFLLQYESDFSTLPHIGPHPVHHSSVYGSGSTSANTGEGGLRVDKYFVLNRIADPDMMSAILGLLRLYSVPESRILFIPFEWEEYQKREFRWDGGVDQLACWAIGGPGAQNTPRIALGKGQSLLNGEWKTNEVVGDESTEFGAVVVEKRSKRKAAMASLRALDYIYHEKNLYAMNNNGGRNFALEHGRKLPHARWILPLDGNSFLTPAAMDSVVRTLSISGEGPSATRYLVIPMARLLENDNVLANNSIALVPNHDRISGSATADAELHHSSDAAPLTLEEPQVGFRFDATESYQPAMRYGRRSKLEFLWRLGAIPYSRGLDRRTFSWEFSDREHVTEATWGSIPGVAGLARDSVVHLPHPHQPHVNFRPWTDSNPARGPLAFSKAGWVYRLFSGDKNQEEVSPEAVTLRNENRIKGIVAFLERLDEKVARGVGECTEPGGCGFKMERLWSFDGQEVERLRRESEAAVPDAVERVDAYETEVMPVHTAVRALVRSPDALVSTSAHSAATNASLLAMAGYLTRNSSYSALAADLINARFVKPTPLFYRQTHQREQLHRYQSGREPVAVPEEEAVGYAFPPLPIEVGQSATWAGQPWDGGPPLPFDPLDFDPTLLLDSIRILALPGSSQATLHGISRRSIHSIVTAQLSFLLSSPEAIALNLQPPTPEAGGHLDAKISALAAFLDDVKLLGRVANRGRLRLSVANRAEGLMHDAAEVREVHWRLIQGLANVKLRPYNLVSDPIAEGRYFPDDSPFSLLGL